MVSLPSLTPIKIELFLNFDFLELEFYYQLLQGTYIRHLSKSVSHLNLISYKLFGYHQSTVIAHMLLATQCCSRIETRLKATTLQNSVVAQQRSVIDYFYIFFRIFYFYQLLNPVDCLVVLLRCTFDTGGSDGITYLIPVVSSFI